MANHVLSLEVPDTMNLCILRIVDTSIYNPLSPVKCPVLQVSLPGFNYSVAFDDTKIDPGFILNLTACDLEIQHSQCGEKYVDLPDGIYKIKYSVSPNDIVYVEYNHLRITAALTIYQSLMCDLDIAACDPPADKKDKLNKLRMIRSFLDAAKAKVEFCHQPDKGMALYNYALKLLNNLSCKTC